MLSRLALLAALSYHTCCLQTVGGLLVLPSDDDSPAKIAVNVAALQPSANHETPPAALQRKAASGSGGDAEVLPRKPRVASGGVGNPRLSKEQPPRAVERLAAVFYVLLFAVAPVAKMCQDANAMTPFVAIHATLMLGVFLGSLVLFTHVVEFLAPAHFVGQRCLTIGEAIYFMSVILGTVGYGDIYPANDTGQMIVTVDVMCLVLLYANVLISQGIKMLKELRLIGHDTEDLSAFGASAYHRHHEDLTLPLRRVASSVVLYFASSGMGVLFWHYFPGEGKSWWESLHLTVLTVTTVGLGDVVPSTGMGMLFAAFWIIFGVMSFTIFVGSFAGLLLAATKRSYRALRHPAQDKLLDPQPPAPLQSEYKAVPHDQYEFLKFHILNLNMASAAEVSEIEKAFQAVKPPAADKDTTAVKSS